jgi:hypothetical protein
MELLLNDIQKSKCFVPLTVESSRSFKAKLCDIHTKSLDFVTIHLDAGSYYPFGPMKIQSDGHW